LLSVSVAAALMGDGILAGIVGNSPLGKIVSPLGVDAADGSVAVIVVVVVVDRSTPCSTVAVDRSTAFCTLFKWLKDAFDRSRALVVVSKFNVGGAAVVDVVVVDRSTAVVDVVVVDGSTASSTVAVGVAVVAVGGPTASSCMRALYCSQEREGSSLEVREASPKFGDGPSPKGQK